MWRTVGSCKARLKYHYFYRFFTYSVEAEVGTRVPVFWCKAAGTFSRRPPRSALKTVSPRLTFITLFPANRSTQFVPIDHETSPTYIYLTIHYIPYTYCIYIQHSHAFAHFTNLTLAVSPRFTFLYIYSIYISVYTCINYETSPKLRPCDDYTLLACARRFTNLTLTSNTVSPRLTFIRLFPANRSTQ